MSEASLAGVSAVKRLGVWGAILWPVKEWFLTTTQLKDWRTTTIQTEPVQGLGCSHQSNATSPSIGQTNISSHPCHIHPPPSTKTAPARITRRGRFGAWAVDMIRLGTDIGLANTGAGCVWLVAASQPLNGCRLAGGCTPILCVRSRGGPFFAGPKNGPPHPRRKPSGQDQVF